MPFKWSINKTHWGLVLKMYEFWLIFHWSLFLRVQLTIIQHWFRQWLGTNQATSHYLNQWWLDYRLICVARPQWFNFLPVHPPFMQKLPEHAFSVQSSAVITRFNIVRYYINKYRNWSRIWIRRWIHKRHPIPRPNGRAMGCLLWIFVRKLTAL